MKHSIYLAFTFLSMAALGQGLVNNTAVIDSASEHFKGATIAYNNCLLDGDVTKCVTDLVKVANDPYKKYIAGGNLYDVDTAKSFALHKEAYLAKPTEQAFVLEYAIELHRKHQYAAAIPLYEKYVAAVPKDYRAYAWLADCYINTGNTPKAIANWKLANHADNHTGIDAAIYIVNGKTEQLKQRSNYRKLVAQGKLTALYQLIYLDMNWEADWWNKTQQRFFVEKDMALGTAKLASHTTDLHGLESYIAIKLYSEDKERLDSAKNLLEQNHWILNNQPLPANANVAADLLYICISNKWIDEKGFYAARGAEIFKLAEAAKDKELLNIYAYLQNSATGSIETATDLLGWKKFNDERFAVSYFVAKGDKNKYNDPELAQAKKDFPNSAEIYLVQVNCAKVENKPVKPLLLELIKREFKSLASDENRYSDMLNKYFVYLDSLK